ncbi:methyltransferase family protein [Lutimonas zeaxanthinifaciens]|uniref:methyltransferase family protein n=1 Tax=Lutimonas zeaxanthinifaciens TaxID=3060215 RepID=UPI00265D3EA9|nr:isoprenylcysteine carboxylmethyltransferase family protein [Lutimonas sp. YSD2104]WKK66989.1 isoprenylcysteine carboxylmethyltransferase family protein [Lutimonas sp. YSD2104]
MLSKVLVTVQFLCFFYFAIFTQVFVSGWGLLVQLFSAVLCIWAVIIMKPGKFNVQPEVKSNASFVRKGPYRIIRNPMYLGLILFFGLTVIYQPKVLHLLIYLVLCLVFVLKIFLEEKFLRESFGKNYEKYKSKTFRLIPFLF